VKALSVRQPWADLIVDGVKDVENRTWKTNIRGRILIHAAKRVEHWVVPKVSMYLGVESSFDYHPVVGAIIGSVEIVDCWNKFLLRTSDVRHKNRWFSGPFGFVMTNAERFRNPVSCPGRQGFFNVDLTALRSEMNSEEGRCEGESNPWSKLRSLPESPLSDKKGA